MRKPPRPHRRHEASLPLIEILVVLPILGLIVGIVVPDREFLCPDTPVRSARVQCMQIHEAASSYERDRGKLPDDLSVLTQEDDKGRALLVDLSNDPWGSPYKLVVDSPTKWKVVSFGPDRMENTADDIASVRNEQ
jgi:hypothetical protein